MSVKDARFDDHWRHALARRYRARFVELNFKNLCCLADGQVRFSGGLSAIVGPNGVGKSTLIAAIADLMADEDSPIEIGLRRRVSGSELWGTVLFEGTEVQLHIEPGPDGQRLRTGSKYKGEFKFLDPSDLGLKCLSQIQADMNFSDLLEAVDPVQLAEEELHIASYLVGKTYSAVSIYEIADYAGIDPFPYFCVNSGGVSYGSASMGRGELSLLLTYWTLRDFKKDSILVLEEPETHVSPASQQSLMNVIAMFADQMGICVIVATNSPTVINRIPQQHLHLLVRDPAGAVLMNEPSKLDISLILGGGVAFTGALIVEDEAAKHFLLSLMEEVSPSLLRQFEIVAAGAEDAITNALRAMPQTRAWLTLVGIYDGDMRARRGALAPGRWPHNFLPGEHAPERLLIDFVRSLPDVLRRLAGAIGRSENQVRLAFQAVEGRDHHDYFRVFAEVVGLDIRAARRVFVRLWLDDPRNLAQAKQLLAEISASVNKPRG